MRLLRGGAGKADYRRLTEDPSPGSAFDPAPLCLDIGKQLAGELTLDLQQRKVNRPFEKLQPQPIAGTGRLRRQAAEEEAQPFRLRAQIGGSGPEKRQF